MFGKVNGTTDQVDVAVKTSSFGWTGSNILGEYLSLGNIAAGDVNDQPMMPFTEFGFFSAWCVGV